MAVVALLVGLIVGFIVGWLVRDELSRPLTREGFGLGVPGEWAEREKVERGLSQGR